jgi:AcrR family transcriptional regulator
VRSPTRPSVAGRRYAGASAEERRERRRSALIEAGLDLLGTQGLAATTVRGVCARAALTERYFYESFADRDGLLLAIFDDVAAGGMNAIISAVSGTREPHDAALAAFGTFVGYLTEDPRRGRVLLLEAHASEALQRRRHEALRAFAMLAVEHGRRRLGPDAPSETDALLTALALVGGLAELLICWLNGDLEVPRERLVSHCAALLVAAAGVRS